jgi:hypothetical protein
VHGWNNEGWTTAYGGQIETYGPICYDFTPPLTTATVYPGPTLPRATTRTYILTLHPTDQYSGVGVTWYYLLGTSSPAVWQVYGGPVTFRASGSGTVYFESQDVAGNWEALRAIRY